MIYRPRQQPTQAATPEELGVEREQVVLTWDGRRQEIERRRVLIGRSKECDVQLEDPNVSRRHAELRQEGASYWIVDLDSTNGIEVNGRRLKRSKLEDGDRIVIGETEVTFRRELA
jgi:pSer/pThr/pTyr-binding forkhead associated (FHA) protein